MFTDSFASDCTDDVSSSADVTGGFGKLEKFPLADDNGGSSTADYGSEYTSAEENLPVVKEELSDVCDFRTVFIYILRAVASLKEAEGHQLRVRAQGWMGRVKIVYLVRSWL